MSVAVPLDLCPTCGYAMDRATCVRDETVVPKVGHFTICLSCAALLRFDAGMQHVVAGADDIAELDDDDIVTIGRARRMIRERGPLTTKRTMVIA